jgi:hypothetical protein
LQLVGYSTSIQAKEISQASKAKRAFKQELRKTQFSVERLFGGFFPRVFAASLTLAACDVAAAADKNDQPPLFNPHLPQTGLCNLVNLKAGHLQVAYVTLPLVVGLHFLPAKLD